MRILQYVYFALSSRTQTAERLGQRLSLPPDESVVRGSRRSDPPLPAFHRWKLVCREPGLRVDEQIDRVMERLRPRRDRVIELARELEREDPVFGGARLSVVRHFDHAGGEAERLSPPDAPLQKLPGQHQLLGWGIDADLMSFLVAANAMIDVDEYS